MCSMKNSVGKRRVYRSFLFLNCFFLIYLFTNAQDYNHTIYLPSRALSKDVLESVDDMAFWLQQSTGKQFGIKTDANDHTTGISLEFVDDSNMDPRFKKENFD